jgi:RNA polymerase sigma factor (sigma-70 family)
MLDSQIVAAIVAGDPDGLAAAYDRYAAPLYAFCQSLLHDQADAADAVQETFIIASAKLDRLRDPDLLKSWLFAVARNECHHRRRARPGGVAGLEAGEVSDDTIDFGFDLERAALTEVAAAAMAAQPLATREIIELGLRQDFDSDDLASTLGISPKQAQALVSRARGQFGKSVAALLAVRSGGRWYCGELDELLDSQDDRLTAATSQEIVRHVHHCRTCSKRKRRDLRPEALLSVLPANEVVRGLRQQVLGVAASDAPDIVAYRADVVLEALPFDEASGFPVPVDRPQRERRLRPAVLALGATAVLAALAAVGLELGLHHSHRQQLAAAPGSQPVSAPQAQAASSSPSQAQGRHSSTPGTPPGSLAAAVPSSTPTTSLSLPQMPPGTTARPPGSRPPSTPASTPPSTPASTPPSTPPTQNPGTLSESPASVALVLSPGGGAASGSFTLTANGSGMTYSISVPAAYAGTLAVSPSSGLLGSGASVTISVIWNSTAALSTSLTVEPGGQAVPVSYQPPAASPGPSAPSAQGLLHTTQDLLHRV